jgi:probable rRNA maturation factor
MSSYTVEVRVEGPDIAQQLVEPEVLRRAAEAVLRCQSCAQSCELCVLVTDDETSRWLNRRHRGVDAPTDVLAFPNEAQGCFVDPPGLPHYLGDVAISFPRAEVQAAEASNELSAELQLLVIHGVLHLLGYDDQTRLERDRMWRAQQAVLDDLGVEVNLPD